MCDRRAWLRWRGYAEDSARVPARSRLAMAVGTALEPVVRDHLASELGHVLVAGDVVGELRHVSGDRVMTGNTDGLRLHDGSAWVNEIKTTNDAGRYRRIARALDRGLVDEVLELYVRQMRRYAAMLSLSPEPCVIDGLAEFDHLTGWLAVYSVASRELVFAPVDLFDAWDDPRGFLESELSAVFDGEPDVPFHRYHPLCQTCPLFDNCYTGFDDDAVDGRYAEWGRRWREADEHERFGRDEKRSLREEMLPEFDRAGVRSFVLGDGYRAGIKVAGDRWRYDRGAMESDGVLDRYASRTPGGGREVVVRRTEVPC